MFKILDRVLETTTTSGTGDITVAGAVAGYRAFSSQCNVGDLLHYIVEAVNANNIPTGDWEEGLGRYSATNTMQRVAVLRSSNANALVSFAAGTKLVYVVRPQGYLDFDPAWMFRAETDCVVPNSSDYWAWTVSGTGAAFATLAVGAENAIGIQRLSTGTTATGRGALNSSNLTALALGNGVAVAAAKIRVPTLSTGTETFSIRKGFIDSVSGESVDGVFLRYTNAVNTGKWECVARSNNVETVVDSGVTVAANTWYNVEITVNRTGTSAEFRINGTVVGTITANIPTGSGRETGYGVMALKSVGTTSVNALDIDYMDVRYMFNAPR